MKRSLPDELTYPLLREKIQDYLNKTGGGCPGHHAGPCVAIQYGVALDVIGAIKMNPYPSCPLWVSERSGVLRVLAYLEGRIDMLDTD